MNNIVNIYFNSLLFISPIVLAGITFITLLKKKILFLRQPIDFYKSCCGKRIFGDNKTFQGFFVMSFATMLYAFLIEILFNFSLWHLTNFTGVLKIFLLGLTYSLSELPNSFIKRQLGIPPGQKSTKIVFRILDKIDSIIGIAIVSFLIYDLSYLFLFFMIINGVAIHFLTDSLMIKFKLKK